MEVKFIYATDPDNLSARAQGHGWAAQRHAQEIGALCDALLAELTKPKRQNRMKARQWARILKVIATRQKRHASHCRRRDRE